MQWLAFAPCIRNQINEGGNFLKRTPAQVLGTALREVQRTSIRIQNA